MPSLRRSTEDVDPLTLAIAPPANESPVERAARLASEKAAKEVSDRIDEEILAAQRNADKKDVVRVLLLGEFEKCCRLEFTQICFVGQSESGV